MCGKIGRSPPPSLPQSVRVAVAEEWDQEQPKAMNETSKGNGCRRLAAVTVFRVILHNQYMIRIWYRVAPQPPHGHGSDK